MIVGRFLKKATPKRNKTRDASFKKPLIHVNILLNKYTVKIEVQQLQKVKKKNCPAAANRGEHHTASPIVNYS